MAPPSGGAVHDRLADAFPATAETPVTWLGTVAGTGVTGADAAETDPVPTLFVAATVNVYAVPLVRPPTVVVVEGGLPVIVVGAWATPPMYGVTL